MNRILSIAVSGARHDDRHNGYALTASGWLFGRYWYVGYNGLPDLGKIKFYSFHR